MQERVIIARLHMLSLLWDTPQHHYKEEGTA
jgi:hypothetical protein